MTCFGNFIISHCDYADFYIIYLQGKRTALPRLSGAHLPQHVIHEAG